MRHQTDKRSKTFDTRKLRQKARRELNEVKEDVPKCISTLADMIKEETSLYCPVEEEFLIRFLRARKFDLSRSFSLIKSYYEMRTKNQELFETLYPETISHVLSEEIQAVLKQRDSSGRQVFLFRAGEWNPDKVNLDDIFRANYLFLEEMTATEQTQICGVVAIVDFEGLGFYQARQFTPKHAIRMVQIIQNSFPCRFQEFHLINQPYVFNFLYSVVKPFLSEKIRKRIYFHGKDLDSLHEHVNPEILPDFLGGPKHASLTDAMKKFNENLMRNNMYYKEMCRFGYNKPIGKASIPSRSTIEGTRVTL